MQNSGDPENTLAVCSVQALGANVVNADDQGIETAKQLHELMGSLRKDVRFDRLQTAIILLEDALDKEASAQRRMTIRYYLITGFLNRFGLHGWIEDLTMCDQYRETITNIVQFGQNDGSMTIISTAAQFIKEFQDSFSTTILDTIINTAERAVSHTEDSLVPGDRNAQLLLLLGSAFVMRYLKHGNVTDLDQASEKYQEAERICTNHNALGYTCFLSLAHIEWLRFMECRELDGLILLRDCIAKAREIDQDGRALYEKGVSMASGATNEAQLREAIELLRDSLRRRMVPHPQRYYALQSLSSALTARFERFGALSDLEGCMVLDREAVSLLPPFHRHRSVSLNNLAATLQALFEQKGNFEFLEEAIALLQEALTLQPTPHPHRVMSLNNLASDLSTRFKHKGAPRDLEEAIRHQREALGLCIGKHPHRPMSLMNLATSLLLYFRRKGDMKILDECITLHREALELQPAPHPDHHLKLNNLADALSIRFGQKGAFEDLNECVVLLQEARDLLPPSHPNRFMSSNLLANILLTRFKQMGVLQDLENSISLYREALDLRPAPHPDRSKPLNGLAIALYALFTQKGNLQDLDDCVVLNREALNQRLAPHPERPASLKNLATGLLTRFNQHGVFQDLDESILLYREALELQPVSDPDRSMTLNNLSSALYFRFDQKGIPQDLEDCVTHYRESLKLRPVPHPDRAMSLNNLASALFSRFREKRISQDLEDCIKLYQEALHLRLVPHPNRSTSLENLASTLSTRFHHKQSFQDLEMCIKLYREALDLRPAPHPDRAMSLNNLAMALSTRFKERTESQDLEEAIAFQQESLILWPAPHPNRLNVLYNLAKALSIRFEHRKKLEAHNPHNKNSANIPTPPSDKDDSDVENAMRYYEEACKYETGSVVMRLAMSTGWAAFTRKYRPESTLNVYQAAIELFPLLVSLDLTMKQRQDVLEHSQELIGEAARCAVDAKEFEIAVTLVSTSRSIFWSQALRLRTPVDELMVTHPNLAKEFITISRQLERGSYSGLDPSSTSDSSIEQSSAGRYTSLYTLAEQRRQIMYKIHEIPGYEKFLKSPSFASLKPAADNGPVVLLTGSQLGCDALIMHNTGVVEHVPLPNVDLKVLGELKLIIRELLRAGKRSIDLPQNSVHALQALIGRDMIRESDDDLPSAHDTFQAALEALWTNIAQPVVKVLGISKLGTPKRVWWCPAGPFTSLPIHAAGIYSDDSKPIDCLFQYAISSYCTSPQDLLHPSPQIAQDFQMTVIIEPDAPGAKGLPFTVDELREIKKHVADMQHLNTHLGLKNAPNQISDVMSSIQQSSFVHFGCHGMQDLKDPLESFLLLSGGKLTMHTIIKECQVSKGALAYLSACDTAKSDEIRPDESLNLVATMMFAGFRSVVGTLWSIFDEDAPIVADIFYQHLFRKKKEAPPNVTDAAYGLHIATRQLRERGKPFRNWVPYVHYGI